MKKKILGIALAAALLVGGIGVYMFYQGRTQLPVDPNEAFSWADEIKEPEAPKLPDNQPDNQEVVTNEPVKTPVEQEHVQTIINDAPEKLENAQVDSDTGTIKGELDGIPAQQIIPDNFEGKEEVLPNNLDGVFDEILGELEQPTQPQTPAPSGGGNTGGNVWNGPTLSDSGIHDNGVKEGGGGTVYGPGDENVIFK